MITIDLMRIDRNDVLAAILELDREAAARMKHYPALIAAGKLDSAAVELRRLALATSREIVACVARGMISECGSAVRVLPVLPKTDAADEGGAK